MAMWLQKIVLTVVAIVPVIAGEIVRMSDCCTAPAVPVVAPNKAVVTPPRGSPLVGPPISAAQADTPSAADEVG